MNPYVTGTVIKELREKKGLTQLELAKQLNVSDKSVSKWETGKGYPDISLLEVLASALGVSVVELFSGDAITNMNVASNMLRSQFYVCPICGNIIHSMGETVVHCHGILLAPEKAEETNEGHKIFLERVEDEYYVQIEHSMRKSHYISFIAALSTDRIQMVKLYPEGNPEARFKINGTKQILFYCNKDGLFSLLVNKYIDGRDQSYDDTKERAVLEQIADHLFG